MVIILSPNVLSYVSNKKTEGQVKFNAQNTITMYKQLLSWKKNNVGARANKTEGIYQLYLCRPHKQYHLFKYSKIKMTHVKTQINQSWSWNRQLLGGQFPAELQPLAFIIRHNLPSTIWTCQIINISREKNLFDSSF